MSLYSPTSVGKSTVLNALLGDKFGQVALKRTTAGINFFRITQPIEESTEPRPEQELSSERELSTINDSIRYKDADDVHKEISKDNKELRSSEVVKEKTFDIRIKYPICKMREDTQLVLIDIPGINEAETSKKYKDYVESNWDTFDCVVVVMDAVQGVNTEEQVSLLKFVHSNNQKYKDVPIVVLGNKMDDLRDEDTIHLIEETHSKTIEIFGNVDCKSMPHKIEGSDEEVDANNANQGEATTAFIPLSAKNAFTYMKAGSIDIDQRNDPKYRDLIDKIGYDEYGRKWSRMKPEEKNEAVFEILGDPAELDERLAGTNFTAFIAALSDFVGGNARQQGIIEKQLEVWLNGICYGSIAEKSISEVIFQAFKRCQTVGRTNVEELKQKFWKVYEECEDNALEAFETQVDPAHLQLPFMELENYYELTLVLEWTDESVRTLDAMKQLLRHQILCLLNKLDEWDFKSFCHSAGGEECVHGWKLKRTMSDGTIFNSGSTYYLNNGKSAMEWKKGWVSPEDVEWETLSPQDWIVVLESLSLAWNQKRFVEEFGAEKVKLNAALMTLYSSFSSLFGIDFDCSQPSDPYHPICLHVYRKEIETNGADSMAKLKMPSSLTDPSHWGFLAWSYVSFCNDRKDHIDKKRKDPVWKYTNLSNVREECGRKKQKVTNVSDGNTSEEDEVPDGSVVNHRYPQRYIDSSSDSD